MQVSRTARKFALISCGALLFMCSAAAQSVQGSLTVTAVVQTSVAMVNENGQWKVVVANAPDPADNVSYLAPAAEDKGAAPGPANLGGSHYKPTERAHTHLRVAALLKQHSR